LQSTRHGKIVEIGRIEMALAVNLRTGKTVNVPDHYLGHEVLGKDLAPFDGAEVKAAPKKENKKKSAEYNPAAVDADGDGLVQEGTEWERLVETEIEEQPAPDNIKENEE
jgi:hypothetical protein